MPRSAGLGLALLQFCQSLLCQSGALGIVAVLQVLSELFLLGVELRLSLQKILGHHKVRGRIVMIFVQFERPQSASFGFVQVAQIRVGGGIVLVSQDAIWIEFKRATAVLQFLAPSLGSVSKLG